jgi:6-phosphogluconate dehydrogenase
VKKRDLESLLFDDFFNKGNFMLVVYSSVLTQVFLAVHKAQPGWRRVIAQSVLWGIPTPAFSTALAFFDGYRSEVVPANLLQAQVLLTSSVFL